MKTIHQATVFIAGSRGLSRLSFDVTRRIDKIVERGLSVIVGDANGVDKAVQRYLSGRQAQNVTVFCMEGGCRNNVGAWPTRVIKAADPDRKDFSYYSTKDRAMAAEADFGLMLWDERSRGTLRNIVDLVQRGKSVVVYLARRKSFQNLHHGNDLEEMLSKTEIGTFGESGRRDRRAGNGDAGRRKEHAELLF